MAKQLENYDNVFIGIQLKSLKDENLLRITKKLQYKAIKHTNLQALFIQADGNVYFFNRETLLDIDKMKNALNK